MRKLIIIFTIILTLVSCGNVEDKFPNELASWDGNYIYYLNYRSKTTGEDSKVLFSDFTYHDILYTIIEVYDSVLTENNIYYVVCGENESNLKNSIVRYNLDNQEVEFIYFTSFHIYLTYCEDDFICFYNAEGRYYLDTNTKEIIEIGAIIPGYGTYKIIDNYLCFANFKDLEYMKIMYVDCDYYVDLINENYLIIKLKRQGHYYQGLYIYDLKIRYLYQIVDVNENKAFMCIDNYFIKGEKQKISCASNPDGFEELIVNSKLYKINFDYPTTFEEVYEFDENKQYYMIEIDHKNILRLKESYVQNKFLFFDSRLKKKNVYFDLNKDKFKYFYQPFNKTEVVERGIICGDYRYTCDRIFRGLATIGFYITRYDMVNEKEEKIQFYLLNEESYETANCRYSDRLFEDYHEYFNNSFILNR